MVSSLSSKFKDEINRLKVEVEVATTINKRVAKMELVSYYCAFVDVVEVHLEEGHVKGDAVDIAEVPERDKDAGDRMEVEEKIADFFEERPFFYNQGDANYKNKQKRNIELGAFAADLGHGYTADNIWKRFVSIRTDIGKLKKLVSKGKSGQGAKRLTQLQQWKLRRYSFLDAYMKPRLLGEELGKEPEDSGTEDGEGGLSVGFEEENGPGTSTEGKQSCSSSKRLKKKAKTSSSVVNVLQNLLDVTRKDMRAAEQRVERLCGEQRAQAADERVAWGQWLTSACLTVPAQSFRLFQRDTFEATMRYLPQVPLADSARLPPPVQVLPASRHTFQPTQPVLQDPSFPSGPEVEDTVYYKSESPLSDPLSESCKLE